MSDENDEKTKSDEIPQTKLAERLHDQMTQLHQSVNEAAMRGGDAALRAALLINGGAAVSVLAFIGGLAAQDRIKLDQLKDVAGSLTLFAFGVIAAVLAMGFAYFTNFVGATFVLSYLRKGEFPYFETAKKTHKLGHLKTCLHLATVLAALSSVALFTW